MWAQKTAKAGMAPPKLATLPPTTEAFRENVLRAHITVVNWMKAIENEPSELLPTEHGWVKDDTNKTLVPKTVPEGVCLAPNEILKLIRCGCESATACKSRNCGCTGKGIPCTIFCACGGGLGCNNPHNKPVTEEMVEVAIE